MYYMVDFPCVWIVGPRAAESLTRNLGAAMGSHQYGVDPSPAAEFPCQKERYCGSEDICI